jgi:hypothetical protein
VIQKKTARIHGFHHLLILQMQSFWLKEANPLEIMTMMEKKEEKIMMELVQ